MAEADKRTALLLKLEGERMRTFTKEELKEILDKHDKWLRCEGGSRANLSGADLSRADLSCANLSGASLYCADLSCANLSGANLYCADLSCANLSGANLYCADLSCANLYCADLSRADLSGANLSGASLYCADLSCANLSGANLYCANLSCANLSGAKIELNLINKFFPLACPESGSFTAWKKANGKIVKLEVLEDAKRSSAYGRKCRCSAARVLAIENADGTDSGLSEVASSYDGDFVYKVGEIAKVDDFDDDRRNECAPGIHFFITRQEAVEW